MLFNDFDRSLLLIDKASMQKNKFQKFEFVLWNGMEWITINLTYFYCSIIKLRLLVWIMQFWVILTYSHTNIFMKNLSFSLPVFVKLSAQKFK